MGMEMKGFDELLGTLTELSSAAFADNAVTKGLMLAGELVQRQAKERVHKITEQLKDSIVVEPVENGVRVGSEADQAMYEEYGTGRQGDPRVHHTTKESWRYQNEWDGKWYTTSGHEPHPFLYPALEAVREQIPDTVKEVLMEKIKERVG